MLDELWAEITSGDTELGTVGFDHREAAMRVMVDFLEDSGEDVTGWRWLLDRRKHPHPWWSIASRWSDDTALAHNLIDPGNSTFMGWNWEMVHSGRWDEPHQLPFFWKNVLADGGMTFRQAYTAAAEYIALGAELLPQLLEIER